MSISNLQAVQLTCVLCYDKLIQQAEADIATNRTKPLDEVLHNFGRLALLHRPAI